MKILIEIDLLRDIDRCILEGIGGYGNRHEFANEAFRSYLFDLQYPDDAEQSANLAADSSVEYAVGSALERGVNRSAAEDERPSDAYPVNDEASGLPIEVDPANLQVKSPEDFALREVDRGFEAMNEVGIISDQPLLGLHNRDWPSIWCLGVLADIAHHGYVEVSTFNELAMAKAWQTADALRGWEESYGLKVTGLLPKNRDKPQASEGAFRSFAIGTIGRRPTEDGRFKVQGPLFQWKTCGLVVEDGKPQIGITGPGWFLLEQMQGLKPGQPHSPEHATSFFSFLESFCQEDYWGFQHLLRAVAGGISRVDLVDRFHINSDWTKSVAATVAQGYLSRAREWGLVEEKMKIGLYQLTNFGEKCESLFTESVDLDPVNEGEKPDSISCDAEGGNH